MSSYVHLLACLRLIADRLEHLHRLIDRPARIGVERSWPQSDQTGSCQTAINTQATKAKTVVETPVAFGHGDIHVRRPLLAGDC